MREIDEINRKENEKKVQEKDKLKKITKSKLDKKTNDRQS